MLLGRPAATRALALLAACALVAGSAGAQEEELPPRPAEQGETGTRTLSVRLSFYDRDDSGGNPFLDEDLTVIEPVVVFDHNVSDDFGYYVKASYDDVSSASIDRLSEFPEQSGASGDYYAGLEFGARHRWADTTWVGWHAGASVEYDYTSIGAGGNVSFEPEGTDAKLTFSLDSYFDTIEVIRFDGSDDESDEDRTSVAFTGRWYQALSPKMHGEFGATVSFQDGFLETPYNAVVIEDDTLPRNPNLENLARGYEVTEEVPDDRLRTAVFGKVRRWLADDMAAELGGRLYSDDWGITGISVEPRFYKDLVPDKLRLRLRYRFYTQTEADFFEDSFTKEEDERTQDSDLGDFSSHSVGAKVFWFTQNDSVWDLGLDYITRDDDLDTVLATVGWRWSF